MFATARETAGRGSDAYDLPEGSTLDAVLGAACDRYGPDFAQILAVSGVWVNGDEAPDGGASALHDGDEVAILPPVSGGAA